MPSWVTGDAAYQKEPNTNGGSRAAGAEDVSGDPHIIAIQVTLDTLEEQMALFAELKARGYKVQIV